MDQRSGPSLLHSGPDTYAEASRYLILSPVTKHSPIVSEFDTPEEEAAYEAWLRAKVAASLADERPPVSHDEVMAEIRTIIAKAGNRGSCRL